jgi:hypothetical protein
MFRIQSCKRSLDKDCIFFWRLFQDILKDTPINFTGLIVLPKIRFPEKFTIIRLSEYRLFFGREIHFKILAITVL